MMVTCGESVCVQVQSELRRQVKAWGEQNHHPMVWLSIIMEELGEAAQAANKATLENGGSGWWEDYRTELVQVASLAVAAMQSFDRGQDGRETPGGTP